MSPPDSEARFWDQRVARLLMRPLASSFITPNHVTAVNLLFGLSAGICYALGAAAANWGGLLFVLSRITDHADGELARMSGRTSRFGHYFDYLTDGVSYTALFTGMGMGLGEGAVGGWSVPLGIFAGVSVGLIFILRDEIDRRLGRQAIAQPGLGGFEIEDVMYLVAPITWLGGLVPFLAVASVGAPTFLIWQLLDFRRSLKRREGSPTTKTKNPHGESHG